MKLRWLGHASFVIETPELTILTDPFGEEVPYPGIREAADVVTVSHEHHDHNAVHVVKGDFQVLRGLDEQSKKARRLDEEVKGVRFKTVPSYHDDQEGKLRGENAIFVMDIDGVTVAHLGDLGEKLTSSQAEEMGKVNVLLIPVGGYYTIDARTAREAVDLLKPDIVVPMHYKTKYTESWPIAAVDDFLEGMENVVRFDGNEGTVDRQTLTDRMQVWLFAI
ncbi:MAG: MBL fold metallo-hydrolase [Bacillota bacterium]|nr:MBL fold metallo-hydrolase [Candidatus Fermentithermobacillaceae bacterium]